MAANLIANISLQSLWRWLEDKLTKCYRFFSSRARTVKSSVIAGDLREQLVLVF